MGNNLSVLAHPHSLCFILGNIVDFAKPCNSFYRFLIRLVDALITRRRRFPLNHNRMFAATCPAITYLLCCGPVLGWPPLHFHRNELQFLVRLPRRWLQALFLIAVFDGVR
jgi:hypothetical protein